MPHDLTPELVAEKNKVFTTGAWFNLYEVYFRAGQNVVYLTDNDAPVTFDGKSWEPYPIRWAELEENSTGDLPSLMLAAGNVLRQFQALLEHHNGLRNEKVVIHLVHSAHLDDPRHRLSRKFRIRQAVANELSATFTLSSHPLFNVGWPYHRYYRLRCPDLFRGEYCGWGRGGLPPGVVDSMTCDHTLDGPNGCRAHGQLYIDGGFASINEWPRRFGGFLAAPTRRGA